MTAAALDTSAAAIAAVRDRYQRSGADIPALRNSAAAFLAYLFLAYLAADEAHHRGYVAALLEQRGSPVPRTVNYGIREWSRARQRHAGERRAGEGHDGH